MRKARGKKAEEPVNIPDVRGIVVHWAPGATEEFKALLLRDGWIDCTKSKKRA